MMYNDDEVIMFSFLFSYVILYKQQSLLNKNQGY